jgi:hypothetical protein
MKPTSRLSIVASVIAALCLAPAAFAKPKDDQQVPEDGGKPAKHGKHGKSGGQTAPAGFQIAPGVTQTRGPIEPGGVGIEVVRPPLPPPVGYYRRGYHPHSDYADSSVASVQRALKARGYYGGPVDGDAGPGTRAAIRGFREEHGLGHSSSIDGTLLHALRL